MLQKLSLASRAGKEKVRKSPNTSSYMKQFIFCSNLNSDCSCGRFCFSSEDRNSGEFHTSPGAAQISRY